MACSLMSHHAEVQYQSKSIVRITGHLYDNVISAVQMNGNIEVWFISTVEVRQGSTLFNIFLERIVSDAQEVHDGMVSIGGRTVTNLRFADGIDALTEEEQELEALVESLDKTCTRYKMEISAEKTKLMTNSANGIQREIMVKGQKLGRLKTGGSLKNCSSHGSSDKTKANMERYQRIFESKVKLIRAPDKGSFCLFDA